MIVQLGDGHWGCRAHADFDTEDEREAFGHLRLAHAVLFAQLGKAELTYEADMNRAARRAMERQLRRQSARLN